MTGDFDREAYGVPAHHPDLEVVQRVAIPHQAGVGRRLPRAGCRGCTGERQGAACFGGTRVPVAIIAGLLDEVDDDTIRRWYPSVTTEHLETLRWWLDRPGVRTLLRDDR